MQKRRVKENERNNADLVASAAGADGLIRLWQVAVDYRAVTEVARVDVVSLTWENLKFVITLAFL